ncbi:glycosyltransferase family 2 protein [Halioglobus sp. HI00S01]|uniref:glycosyltransferase family 2 protein n=1 Tax=Halioglobus sp. HI00S01 TaxID=1822214 RepID=UPI0018D2CD82
MNTATSAPHLSVVIPTYGRPAYLSRAVDSALESAESGEVEVIVIPNGPDESWKGVMNNYQNRTDVIVRQISVSHANVARNIGLSLARGKYVRFLDDDDFLLPAKAREQLHYMEREMSEVCSGRLEHRSEDQVALGQVGFTREADFVIASCEKSGFTLPTGNVFLRSALKNALWNENVPRLQDNVWMLDLAGMREWRWSDFPEVVGVWFHHGGDRVSSVSEVRSYPVWIIDALRELCRRLQSAGRLSRERRLAIATAIWRVSHEYFPLHPMMCTRAAKIAIEMDATSRPPIGIYDGGHPMSWFSPLLVEWVMIPKRFLNHWRRVMIERKNVSPSIRRL